MLKYNLIDLVIAARLIDSLQRLIEERKDVEIYFHPGIDPDAEASVRLAYLWVEALGASNVRVYHYGKPTHLTSIEPILEAQDITLGSLLDENRAQEVVTIVLDVSNMRFLAGEHFEKLNHPDFVFDHHHPSGSKLHFVGRKVSGGRLVIPEMQCTSLLLDRLITMSISPPQYLAEHPKLAGLVLAAALTDQDLEVIDKRPTWFSEPLWSRLDEIRDQADQSVVDHHATEPWQNQTYLDMEINALESNLRIEEIDGVNVAFVWCGQLESSQRHWIAHFAGVIQKRRERVQRHLPDGELAFTCALASLDEPRAIAASVRSNEDYDAGRIMNVLAPKEGGGRETAAGAMMIRPSMSADALSDLGKETLVEWVRRSKRWVKRNKATPKEESAEDTAAE